MTRHLTHFLAITALCGCYRYVPQNGVEPMPGSSYRAYLSTTGVEQVSSLLGRDVARFDGVVLAVSDSAYLFSMGATLTRAAPRPTIWSGEQLTIPRSTVARFELRELDRPKTMRAAILSTVGMLAAGSLILQIKGKVSGSGAPPPPPPPP